MRFENTDGTSHAALFAGITVGIGYLSFYATDLYRISVVAYALAFGVVFLSKKGTLVPKFRKWIPGFALFVGYYSYAALSAVWSPDPGGSLAFLLLSFSAVLPALLLGLVLCDPGSIRSVYLFIAVLFVALAMQSIIFAITSGDPSGTESIGSFRTLFAGVLCAACPMLVARALVGDPRVSRWTVALASLVFVLVIASRTALLLVPPATIGVLWLKHRSATAFFVTLVLTVAGLLYLTNTLEIPARFSAEATSFDFLDVPDTLGQDEVDIDRRIQANTGLRLFLENPIFGAGYGAVLYTNELEYDRPVNAHGFFPGLAGEIGVVGLAILLVLTGLCLKRIRASLSPARGRADRYLTASFGVAFLALIGFGFFHQLPESPIFALLVGVALRAGDGRAVPGEMDATRRADVQV